MLVRPGIDAIEGSLGMSDAGDVVDVFELKFEDAAFTAFNVTWTAPNTSNSSILLFDAEGQVVDACDQSDNPGGCIGIFGNTGVEVLSAMLPAGTYYLEIEDDTPASSPIGPYGVEFSPATNFSDGFESRDSVSPAMTWMPPAD